jgi:hypothetical protein
MAKKMSKILMTVVLVLVLLIAAISLGIKFYGGSMVKKGIETVGPKVLQVPVRVDSVNLWTLLGKLEMKNLEIDNPEEYEHEQFLKMGFAHIKLNVGSLFSDTVEIEKMQFDGIEVVMEQKGLTNNLQQILNNLPKTEEKPAEEKPKDAAPSKSLVIKDLYLNDVSVKIKLLPVPGKADTLTLDLAPIHMTDIGKDKKVDSGELIAKILKAIAAGIAEQGKDILPTEMIGPLTDSLKETGKQIMETGQEAIKEGTDLGKGVGDAVKGLFKKKEE